MAIEKALIDMSGVSFTSRVFKYDGNPHSIVISGDLPSRVSVAYENNTRTVEGTQKAYARFTSLDNNYALGIVYMEYIYTGNDIIVMVDVTDENGTPVAYSVIVTDTGGATPQCSGRREITSSA